MTSSPQLHLLGDLSPSQFLREYWQKKPLLIRQAFPDFQLPFDGNDLAGLSLEEDSFSRIVLEKGGKRPWEVRHGPFTKKTFSLLPKDHWTLLVQETDHWIPEVAAIRKRFRFIPDWRMDDVMISYATDQGSVGPHTDNYDVFLLQGQGKRRWLIESTPRSEEKFLPKLDLRILSSFQPDQDYLLEPGDMLYLPPRYAHHGIAEGESITLSIGLRAPSVLEILGFYLEDLSKSLGEEFRYRDLDLRLQKHPAEIDAKAISRVLKIIQTLPIEKEKVEGWFGQLVTSPKRSSQQSLSTRKQVGDLKKFQERLQRFQEIKRREDVRLAFIRQDDGGVRFFVDGNESLTLPHWTPILEKLTEEFCIKTTLLRPYLNEEAFLLFLEVLVRKGFFYFQVPAKEKKRKGGS